MAWQTQAGKRVRGAVSVTLCEPLQPGKSRVFKNEVCGVVQKYTVEGCPEW